MSSTFHTTARRKQVVAAFLSAAALAACGTDQPTSPRASIPESAAMAKVCLPKCVPEQILYVKADPIAQPWPGHIWVMNTDTTGKTQITFGNGDDDHPAWSPDYKKVVFSSDRRSKFEYELFVVNVDGTGLKRITDRVNQSSDLYPTWAPDGSKIYFIRRTPDFAKATSYYEIWSVNANGSGLTKVSNDTAMLFNPSVSPDGKKIAFARLATSSLADARLYTMNVDGTGMAMLTDGWLGDSEVAWSPDGSKLAFSCRVGYVGYRDICTVNADGTNRTGIVTWAGDQMNPTFSRDGTRLVFEHYPDGYPLLFSVKLDGSGAMQVSPNGPSAYYGAAWSR
jgi:Tol biopolymer transport system component